MLNNPDSEYEWALKVLELKFREAKNDERVLDPVCYALYHTWAEIRQRHVR